MTRDILHDEGASRTESLLYLAESVAYLSVWNCVSVRPRWDKIYLSKFMNRQRRIDFVRGAESQTPQGPNSWVGLLKKRLQHDSRALWFGQRQRKRERGESERDNEGREGEGGRCQVQLERNIELPDCQKE